ncbi:hypothetical protein BRAS3843_940010 [Bradyrhizobium sp. STM 3843]|nr:hypothetical protein BRAS3843_940010 [Bradyrhizobium sp. STM 3843]
MWSPVLHLIGCLTAAYAPFEKAANDTSSVVSDGNGIGLTAARFQSFSSACFPFVAQSARARSL